MENNRAQFLGRDPGTPLALRAAFRPGTQRGELERVADRPLHPLPTQHLRDFAGEASGFAEDQLFEERQSIKQS